MVSCSKSRTTVVAGRYTQCRLANVRLEVDEDDGVRGHQEVDEEDVKRAVAESLPKNLIAAHPVQGSRVDEGSGGTCSSRTCARKNRNREAL
jgi:hypothetical protein